MSAGAPNGSHNDGPLIYLIAGEPSGDLLGGRLMASLKDRQPGVRFAGVGGARMGEQGLDSLFPMSELSTMGLAEIVPHIPHLLQRIKQTVAEVERLRPAVLITIDAPEFNFRVAKKLQGQGIPLIHYVAPTVWAWKPWRARKVAAFLDHLMALLPFEPPYFEAEGLDCTFVGHPVVVGGADGGDGAAFRGRHGIGPDERLLCVLPGSRRGEVGRLLPVFSETVDLLARRFPDLRLVVPTAETVAEAVEEGVAGWPLPTIVTQGEAEKFDAFAAADLALAASGTVALELAMAGTPAVIGYRLHKISAFLARRLVKVDYANIANIILDRPAVPEYLLEDCHADMLAPELIRLLEDPAARTEQTAAVGEAMRQLGVGGPSPSERAADVVLEVIGRGG